MKKRNLIAILAIIILSNFSCKKDDSNVITINEKEFLSGQISINHITNQVDILLNDNSTEIKLTLSNYLIGEYPISSQKTNLSATVNITYEGVNYEAVSGGISITDSHCLISGIFSFEAKNESLDVVIRVKNSYFSNFDIENNGIFFNPNLNYEIVYDIEGNSYKTIQIGNQIWMAENLKTTRFNDGTYISEGTNIKSYKNIEPFYYWYDNDSSKYCEVFGPLYNWYVVNNENNEDKNICPDNWHVPSNEEWNTLISFLGEADIAGGKMKEFGTFHWNFPNSEVTNESGFSALPGGELQMNNDFLNMIDKGYWWTSTEYDTDNAWSIILSAYNIGCGSGMDNKQYGKSIRCIKNDK